MDSQVRDLAEKYLRNVRPSGSTDLKATCPFHKGKDTDRTFCISTRTGAWICFHSTCRLSGSWVQLLKLLGMSPRLVERFIEKSRKRTVLTDKMRRKAYANEKWNTLPEYILGAYSGLPELLLDQGFTEDTLRTFEVGVDRKYERIVYPIRNHIGRLVAISGRNPSKTAVPKYKVYDAKPPDPARNRKAGELYGVAEPGYQPENRKHLYGIHLVYAERYHRWKDDLPPIVLTEGYKSTMWLHQLGYRHALGLQGSSLTAAQLKTLSRMRGPFCIMLDLEVGKHWPPDRNGRCAAVKIAKQLRSVGVPKMCRYPENAPLGTQPDDLDATTIQAAIETAETPSTFILREINGNGRSPRRIR